MTNGSSKDQKTTTKQSNTTKDKPKNKGPKK